MEENMESIELLKPNPKLLEITQNIIKQNQKILEINYMIAAGCCNPILQVKADDLTKVRKDEPH
jgi:hypothetical protein